MVVRAGQWYCEKRKEFLKLLAWAAMCLGRVASWGALCFELSPLKAV